jgi:hypothetical protein
MKTKIKTQKLFITTVIALTLAFTSCGNLKKQFGSAQDNKSYQERLTAFSTISKGDKLTFMGERYNYTFSNTKGVSALFKNQKLIKPNPSNMSFRLRIKEYKSSVVTLNIFSHFEKSSLNKKQITWLEAHHYKLEQRARAGGKKSEPRPKEVATYVQLWELVGKREVAKTEKQAQRLMPSISLEVSEHKKR